MDVPTHPITATVQSPFAGMLSNISSSELLSVILLIVFVAWALYTVVVAYHWIRYGHRSLAALPALAVHVGVSLWLGLFAVSGFY